MSASRDMHARRVCALAVMLAAALAGWMAAVPPYAMADQGVQTSHQTYDAESGSWGPSAESGANNSGAVTIAYTVEADDSVVVTPTDDPTPHGGSPSPSPSRASTVRTASPSLPRTGDQGWLMLALACMAAASGSLASCLWTTRNRLSFPAKRGGLQ